MYQRILLPVDLEHDSSWTGALPRAVEICRASGASLHVLTVLPDFGMSIVSQYFPEGYEQEVAQKTLQRLHDFVKQHVPDDISAQHIVGEGNPYEVILKIAGEIDADLIVMASHRPELKDYLLGPNAARVVRHANCSVLVHREE